MHSVVAAGEELPGPPGLQGLMGSTVRLEPPGLQVPQALAAGQQVLPALQAPPALTEVMG
jgi:hypothetical protein